MLIRVDRLPNEWGAVSRGRPCAGAVRKQALCDGRLESWWELDVENLDAFLDLLRRCEGRRAVVEILDPNQERPGVRVWIVEATWPRTTKHRPNTVDPERRTP